MKLSNSLRSAEAEVDLVQFNQSLGLAVGRREVEIRRRGTSPRVEIGEFSDHLLRFVDAGLRLGCACFGAAPQPLNLRANAVLERFLPLRLSVQVFVLLLKEGAVVALHAQQAVRVGPVQFSHVGGDVLQEVPIVTDNHTAEGSVLEQLLEPNDARQVEMVGGLVEQQQIGCLHNGRRNRQPLAPAAGERLRLGIEVLEASASQRLRFACIPFAFGNTGFRQRGADHGTHRVAGLELRVLVNVAEAHAFAHGHFTGVRFAPSSQNLK